MLLVLAFVVENVMEKIPLAFSLESLESNTHILTRVVSLYPGHSDNIYCLASNDLVALSVNDDDSLLPHLPRLSPKSNAEHFLTLSPDLIITRTVTRTLNPSTFDTLERLGVKVLTIDPPKWADFEDYLAVLGSALGVGVQESISMFRDVRQSISESVPVNAKKPRVFLEATSREIRTCAPDSWASKLIDLAGGVNIAADAQPLNPDSALAFWGVERVLQSAQSIDIYIIQSGAMNNSTLDDFRARSWSKALTHAKVVVVPERLISRPSLLGLQEGGKLLLKLFWGD